MASMTESRSENETRDFLCSGRGASCRIPLQARTINPGPYRRFCVSQSEIREGLFERFEELIQIEVCRNRTLVPENNKLLRCFQYIQMAAVSLGDYCWNGDCTNCQVWYRNDVGETKSALACRLYAWPGMVITGLSPNLASDLSYEGDAVLGLKTNL